MQGLDQASDETSFHRDAWGGIGRLTYLPFTIFCSMLLMKVGGHRVATDKNEKVSYPEFRRVGHEGLKHRHPEEAPWPPEPEPAGTTNAKLLASLSEAVALLQPAQEEIERLHTQLIEAKEAHRKVALELVAVEMREAGSKAELNDALADRADSHRQALREEILSQEKRRQRGWWRLGR